MVSSGSHVPNSRAYLLEDEPSASPLCFAQMMFQNRGPRFLKVPINEGNYVNKRCRNYLQQDGPCRCQHQSQRRVLLRWTSADVQLGHPSRKDSVSIPDPA
jgi:hypothetical protein